MGATMTDPVEFIKRKLAMVDAVVKEEAVKVEHLAAVVTEDDEPLYVYDDDYHHPVLGDALAIIRLAEATRELLSIHGVDHQCVPVHGLIGWTPQPCETVKLLAQGWGWTEGQAENATLARMTQNANAELDALKAENEWRRARIISVAEAWRGIEDGNYTGWRDLSPELTAALDQLVATDTASIALDGKETNERVVGVDTVTIHRYVCKACGR